MLPMGIYFVSILTGQGKITTKIISAITAIKSELRFLGLKVKG